MVFYLQLSDSPCRSTYFQNGNAEQLFSAWWLRNCWFSLYLGKWSNLTNIFQMGWNHQLVLFLPWRSLLCLPQSATSFAAVVDEDVCGLISPSLLVEMILNGLEPIKYLDTSWHLGLFGRQQLGLCVLWWAMKHSRWPSSLRNDERRGLSTNQITCDSGLYHAIRGVSFTTMTRPLFFAKETIIFPAEQKSPMEHAPLDVLLGEFISLFVPALLWSDSVEIMAPSSTRKVV